MGLINVEMAAAPM